MQAGVPVNASGPHCPQIRFLGGLIETIANGGAAILIEAGTDIVMDARGTSGSDVRMARAPNQVVQRDAVRAVHEFIQIERRVPARVFSGAEAVPPADFLAAMAAGWSFHRQHGKPLAGQTLSLGRDVRVLPERQLAKTRLVCSAIG